MSYMADLVGQKLGNYRLLQVLGQGAFATVYLGEHQYLERSAAIKVLHVQIELAHQESFRREARTIAQLHHPHIIGVHDFGFEGETPYLVMEYMQGGTLRSRYPKETRLPFEQIVAYVKQIASALDYAHEQHVIHRDVKPENILLGANHEVVLSDFGIAVVQHTLDSLSTQNSAGTSTYMAPEQIQRQACPASDQYALGVMVYEWLCGEPPFLGSLFEVFSQHLYNPPPSLRTRMPQLPPAVEDVVFRALAKDPAQRFDRVADFAVALSEAFLATQPFSPNGPVEYESQDQSVLPAAHVPLVSVPSPNEQEQSTKPDLKTVPYIDREHEVVQSVSPQFTTHSHAIPRQARDSSAQTAKRVSVQEQNRTRMLQRLRRTYEELFAQSLQGVTQMELGLADKPNAVQNAATLLFQSSTSSEQILPPGTSILQVYDEAAYELLILGAPGAGKSTLLVELARQLVVRADTDETHPLPVIVPLSSWAVKRPPLQNWLAEQVAQFYNIPQVLAQQWIDEDQLLLLLDGLDEMEVAALPACIAAINAYHRDHLRLPLVVCSRQAEYEEASRPQRLTLQNAVVVQPLTNEQVQMYLAQVGEPLSALCHVLATNPVLAEVTTTPLMVHILILTYQGTSVQELSTQHETLQQQIWTDYFARMVERKGNAKRYPQHQTRTWLGWLAHQMRTHNQTVFYLEHLQPDWFTDRQRRTYQWLGVRLPAIMIGTLVSLLIGWLSLLPISDGIDLLREVTLGGVLGGLLCPTGSNDTTRPTIKTRRRWRTALFVSIGVGLIIGVSTGWGKDHTLNDWLLDGGTSGVIFGLSSLPLQYILSRAPHRSSSPSNPGSGEWGVLKSFVEQLHLLRALLVSLLVGLSQGLSIGLKYGQQFGLNQGLSYGLSDGVNFGLSLGLSLGLASMLTSVILEHLQEAIYLTERLTWTWQNLRKRLLASAHLRLALLLIGCIVLFVLLFVGLSYGLADGLSYGLDYGLIYGLSIGLESGLLYWLLLGLYQSIGQERIEDQDRRVPNQGIRLSLRNGLLLGLISGTMIAGIGIVTFALSYWSYGLGNGLSYWLSEGLRTGLSSGWDYVLSLGPSYFWSLFVASIILIWVLTGGLAVWRHYLIRFLLRRAQTFPLNASQFLDDATARILLRRLGGGYRFTHRLLLDSLADATERSTEPLSASS